MRQLRAKMQNAPGEFKLLALLGRHAQLDGIGMKDLYRLGRCGVLAEPRPDPEHHDPVHRAAAASGSAPARQGLFADFRDDGVVEAAALAPRRPPVRRPLSAQRSVGTARWSMPLGARSYRRCAGDTETSRRAGDARRARGRSRTDRSVRPPRGAARASGPLPASSPRRCIREVAARLAARGIPGLYAHQADAIDALRDAPLGRRGDRNRVGQVAVLPGADRLVGRRRTTATPRSCCSPPRRSPRTSCVRCARGSCRACARSPTTATPRATIAHGRARTPTSC